MSLKIALIGPESTGKTTLCMQLAEHFEGLWVPEAAREYLTGLNRSYTAKDVEKIAFLQMKAETEAEEKGAEWLFCDTNLLVIKQWMIARFDSCPDWILQEINHRKYDLHILLKPDIGWQFDVLRENPNDQWHFFELYKQELSLLTTPWIVVDGDGEQRFHNALSGIRKVLNLRE